MIDKLWGKSATWTNYILPGYRQHHPVKAQVVDAAILATWTCWLLGSILIIWELLK